MSGAGMTAPAFVAQCQRQGIRLTVVEGKLKASGNPPPKPEAFAAFLKARKAEIVEELIGLPKAGTSASFEGVGRSAGRTEADAGKSGKEAENAPSCAQARTREVLPQEVEPPALAESTRNRVTEGTETTDRFSPASQWLDELADRMIEGRRLAETLGVASLNVDGLEIAEPARWLSLAAGRLGRFVERCRELQGRGEEGLADLARVERELIAESARVEAVLVAIF